VFREEGREEVGELVDRNDFRLGATGHDDLLVLGRRNARVVVELLELRGDRDDISYDFL
jgi:hypothetical protein